MGYRVLYAPRNLLGNYKEVNTTDASVQLNGLKKFTSYCIRVGAVVNSSMHGPLSACIYVSTDEDSK